MIILLSSFYYNFSLICMYIHRLLPIFTIAALCEPRGAAITKPDPVLLKIEHTVAADRIVNDFNLGLFSDVFTRVECSVLGLGPIHHTNSDTTLAHLQTCTQTYQTHRYMKITTHTHLVVLEEGTVYGTAHSVVDCNSNIIMLHQTALQKPSRRFAESHCCTPGGRRDRK